MADTASNGNAPFSTGTPGRVLLIDDDARSLRALQALLRAHVVFAGAASADTAMLAAQHDVDVVICNRDNQVATGVEILSELKHSHPRALRILIDSHASIEVIRDAVNRAEIFRFLPKPWVNTQVRTFVDEGVHAAHAPMIATAALAAADYEHVRARVAVVVMEDDSDTQQRLREMLQSGYKVHFANSAERALQIMEQHETGAVICNTRVGRNDLTLPLKILKQSHPHIGAIVISEHTEVDSTIALVNQAQVFRLLPKPAQTESCRAAVDTALTRYWRYKQNPAAARRVLATPLPESMQAPADVPAALLHRIRSLPGRLGGLDSH